MKRQFQGTDKIKIPAKKKIAGPSLYETEYLSQVAEELKIFLKSKNISTIEDIYLGFQGGDYQGKMLLSRGA